MNAPVISYVVTSFNKAPYIGYTIRSLIEQEGDIPAEYIIVDDVSTDNSIEVIEQAIAGVPSARLVKNTENKGPSVRVNQAAGLARGEYIQFIDSDDVMAANASKIMLDLLKKHDADVIYGRWKKTGIPSKELMGTRIDEHAPRKITDTPMQFKFEERVLRMTQLVKRETFMASGGCDEGVFIQDESLALRLCRVSKRLILLDAPTVMVPLIEGELSGNISQMNHDRFLAMANMLRDFPELPERIRRLLYRNCASAVWKQHRHTLGLPRALATRAFIHYTIVKHTLPAANNAQLQQMRNFFAQISGVRRADS